MSFSFVWGFSGGDQVQLQSCTPISLFVSRDEQNGSTTQAIPPFTLIAYPDSGIPTADLLGTGPTDLSWTPRFPAGTRVLINVVDAIGNSGGIAQVLYTVADGTSTSCIPNNPSSDLSVTIDAPDTINTCDDVPIQIQGGQRPYHVTIAITNSAAAINITMSAANDYYQWVERADPNQSLIIAVSDSNGQYAPNSKVFSTGGSTDKVCSGRQDEQSALGTSSSIPYESPTSHTSQPSASSSTPATPDTGSGRNLTGAIVGTMVGILVVLGLIAFWFFRRRRNQSTNNSSVIGGGFGLRGYKRGENMPGNESFVPLQDSASPSIPRTPLYGDYSSSHHNPSSISGSGGQRPVSGFDYYASPPSNYSGTIGLSGPDRIETVAANVNSGLSGSSQPGLGAGLAAGAAGAGVAAAGHMSKRQQALEEQQRNQRWGGSTNYPPAPESVYPPQSSHGGLSSTHSANPFEDPNYPYRTGAPSNAPPSTVDAAAYGYTTPSPTPGYQPSHSGSGAYSGSTGSARPGGSQDTMTPAARAKAAEAARERGQVQQQQPPQPAHDDDDEDPIPFMQRARPILGVTNPDRASTVTNSTANDAYGGVDHSRPGTQVYQHEDAGGVVELPPAYREFQRPT